MRKNKLRICGLIVALALLAGVPALAQISFQGTVVSSKTIAVNAPFGGIVDEIDLRKGDPIQVGGPVATIRPTKVFAEMDVPSAVSSPGRATRPRASPSATAR